jgi:thiol-disulfide isomerase/thioredoxin
MSNAGMKRPALKIIALAAVAGMAIGALGVYVMATQSGNTALTTASTEASCPAREEAIARVDEAIGGEVAAMLPADPSQPLGDLAFNDSDGAPMTLADLSGKTLLINLWATWCAPCREEMPALDQLQAEMGDEDFEVVAVNIDTGTDEKPQAFLNEIGVADLAYYRDASMGLFNELRRRNLAIGLPVTLLVDDEGCLLGHMNGPAEWASEDARALISAAMATP